MCDVFIAKSLNLCYHLIARLRFKFAIILYIRIIRKMIALAWHPINVEVVYRHINKMAGRMKTSVQSSPFGINSNAHRLALRKISFLKMPYMQYIAIHKADFLYYEFAGLALDGACIVRLTAPLRVKDSLIEIYYGPAILLLNTYHLSIGLKVVHIL